MNNLAVAFDAIHAGLKRAKENGLEVEFIYTLIEPFISLEEIPDAVSETCYEWDI